MVIPGGILFLLLLVVHGSIQKSSPASLTYRAAVVEYKAVFYKNDPTKTVNDNAMNFVGYIEQAARKDVDIIVFPEMGLTSLIFVDRPHMVSRSSLIPHPSQNYAPCKNSSMPVIEAVKKIACAAEQNSIYVVVNLLEKEVCTENNCPSDGIFVYITSVTFDRQGTIIARFRKGHLLAEDGLVNAMKTPEISTFDTDFGVTFGNIICFDIMYEYPWLTLTRKLNITDIIFSAGWYSEMPFLTTIQMEAGWAYTEDVNILASGHNKVEWTNSGSGIYAGRSGVVTAVLPMADHEELLIADVPKKIPNTTTTSMSPHDKKLHLRLTNENQKQLMQDKLQWEVDSEEFSWRYDKLNDFETKIILADGYTMQKLNHIGIECEFKVNVTNMSPPVTYRLIAYDGVRHFGAFISLGTRICAIVQCANGTIDSCGHIQKSSAIFSSISIEAIYVDNTRTVMMPSTLGSNMLPLDNWTLDQVKEKEHVITTISLTRPTRNLVTFGIWGRNFANDRTNVASRTFDQFLCFQLLLVLLASIRYFS